MSQREEKVLSLHKHGYNCAQALICSYQDILPFEEKELFKLTEGLGRGVAGLEETCCIPILIAMIYSCLKTCDGNVENPQSKLKSYACGKCLAMDLCNWPKSIMIPSFVEYYHFLKKLGWKMRLLTIII